MQNFPDTIIQDSAAYVADFANTFGDSYDPAAYDAFSNMLQEYSEYNDENTPGVPAGFRSYKDDEGKLDNESLSRFERVLRGEGVNEAVTSALMSQLASMQGMPTLGQIMRSVREAGNKEISLTDQEQNILSSMMARMGAKGEDLAALQEMAGGGAGLKALQKFEGMLKDGEEFTMTREEAAALAKSLGLSSSATSRIMEMFGENSEMTFNRNGFAKLFAAGYVELTDQAAEMSKMRAATSDAINKMLEQDKLASNNAISTSNRTDNATLNAEALMRDSATSMKEDEEGTTRQQRSSTAMNLSRENTSAMQDSTQQESSAQEGFGREGKQGGKRFLETAEDVIGRNASNLKASAEQSAEAAKASFASKVEVISNPLINLNQPLEAPAQQSAGDVRSASYFNNYKMLEQVENSILKHAIDGSRQIIMRLDPPDMGRLTLNLSVSNGEVKAILTAEKAETSSALQEQLAEMKASLEEQGLKVASIEIETSTQQQMDNNLWSSANQHNQQQRMQEQARNLRLSRMRANEGESLAQSMQHNVQTARNAEVGLHIIA